MFSLSKYALKSKAISSVPGPSLRGLALAAVVSSVVSAGCAYRFSNKNLQTPEGIRTIAVEAVFDTSREVLHHEHLWSEIQKALATDGHLRLVPVSKADALVRAHIRAANFVPSGDTLKNGPEDDPKVLDREAPEAPTDFKVLTQAGKYRDKAVISTVVEVEVWNLRTRTLIVKRTYGVQDSLQTIHASITPKGNDFLRLEEATDAKFHALTRNVAQQLVRDLFIY
jgi:hypothetical protein